MLFHAQLLAVSMNDFSGNRSVRSGNPDEGEGMLIRQRGFMGSLPIEVTSHLLVGRRIAQTETAASIELLQQLKRRGHPDAPPPLVSDGWGGHRDALLEVYGQVLDDRGREHPPTRQQSGEEWQYLQMVKRREHRRVIGVDAQVVFGDPRQVTTALDTHTAYAERTHLTLWHMNGRLVRKTLGFSELLRMLDAASLWESMMCNFACHARSLRLEVNDGTRRWLPRSPAMAAG
jgi:hypothetical protein